MMIDTTSPSTRAALPDPDALNRQIEQACHQACESIAPAWPLDRAIAVNPHWSRIGMPLRRVAARMAVLGGIQ
ncbi:putative inorganic carbon transporter subunit DabA, partial [Pseudomonas aeruginosa]